MTISSLVNRVSAAGNGVTTAFAFGYLFLADADLIVISVVDATGVETTKTLTTDYTVSGAANPAGGTVTMLVAPPAGTTLVIYRDPSLKQLVDLVENDPLPVETAVEQPLDKLTMIAQRSSERIDRSLRFPEGDTGFTASDGYLPAAVARAGMLLGFDDDGAPTAALEATAVTPFAASLLDDTTAAEARTTLGVVIGTDVQAYDADLADIAALSTTSFGRGLLTSADAAALRTSAGLGALAVLNTAGTSQIDNDAVTYAKIQNVSATSRILGRKTAAAGDTEECTLSEILDFIGSATKGDILYRDTSSWARLAASTAGTVLTTNGAGTAPSWTAVGGTITLGTPQATTSGTSKDFTGIPSTAKQITMNFDGVSTNGSSFWLIRIGDSGGLETTGYTCGFSVNGASALSNETSGFGVNAFGSASIVLSGTAILTLLNASTNTWCITGTLGRTDSGGITNFGGSKSLSATLDRISLTTLNGTDAFDAGSVNITYL